MNRRFAAVLTAFFVLLTAFPVHAVYAADLQGNELIHTADGLSGEENKADKDIILEDEPLEQDQNPTGKEQLENEGAEIPASDEIDSDLSTPSNIEELDSQFIREAQDDVKIIYSILTDANIEPYFLHTGENAGSLAVEMEAYAMYSRFAGVPCEIVWRYDALDTETPGRRMLVGDIVLPPGCVFADEPLMVECVVIVYDDSGAPFVRLAKCVYTNLEVPVVLRQGMTDMEAAEAFAEATQGTNNIATCVTEDGDVFTCPYTVDFSMVDTHTPGVYYPVTVELPGGVTFGGLEFWMIAVHVVPDDEVDLRAVSLGRNWYDIQWLYRAIDPVLWVSVDGGDWGMDVDENGYHTYGRFYQPDQEMINGFHISFGTLEAGHTYRFQVDYDGDRHSNVLVLDFTENGIPKATNEHGGDRNGGDREENKPPLGLGEENGNSGNDNGEDGDGSGGATTGPSEPTGGGGSAPDPDKPTNGGKPTSGSDKSGSGGTSTPDLNKPSSGDTAALLPDKATDNSTPEPKQEEVAGIPKSTIGTARLGAKAPAPVPISAPPAESSDEYSVTLSGSRLLVMLEHSSGEVSFFHGDLRATVSAANLETLGLTPYDIFTVTLYQLDEHSFVVGFALNGNPIGDVWPEPFSVRIPWNGGAVSCNIEGNDPTEGAVDNVGQIAEFTLMEQGIYLLTEQINNNSESAVVAGTPVSSTAQIGDSSLSAGKPSDGSWTTLLLIGTVGLGAAGAFYGVVRKGWWRQP